MITAILMLLGLVTLMVYFMLGPKVKIGQIIGFISGFSLALVAMLSLEYGLPAWILLILGVILMADITLKIKSSSLEEKHELDR